MKRIIFILLTIFLVEEGAFCASITNAYATLEADTLCIGNNLIERKFLWNKGNLITISLADKLSGQVWINQNRVPDFFIPQQNQQSSNSTWKSDQVESPITPIHTEVTVEYTIDRLRVRKVYRVYPDCPAIACDIYLKGEAKGSWVIQRKNLADLKNIESRNVLSQQDEIPVLDQISLQGNHWHIHAVEFFDISDYYNTLVRPYDGLSYHENTCRGNLLFFQNMECDRGLFFLKEAPCSGVQLSYPGADFITKFGQVKVIGLGLTASDLQSEEWIRAYSSVAGVYNGGEEERLTALQTYQKKARKLVPNRDEMVLMNTWGDRGKLSRLTENFCIRQIEACAKLGITHFQLDDGWQQGRDVGTYQYVYKNPDFWKPNKILFPNGLGPIVQKGKELGVEVCLYLNPSLQNDNEDWEKDANSIIYLYKTYGIRTFKIDGQMMPNKIAEIRTRKMYDKIIEETDGNAFFNLDITAGLRGGYFLYNEFGNLFVENRYTEWGNYYPFRTLRNLWMLSRYVPAEKLLMEFPNKWKNQDKYGDDPFAPANYSFDYLFATTMAAQPLAWMDVADLPEEAFVTQKLIKKYNDIQHEFHQGIILPIGNEPSGKSWTGFQSIREKQGYILVFREKNPDSTMNLKLYLKAGTTVTFTPLSGQGKKMTQQIPKAGTVRIDLPEENSFVLYRYNVN